MYECTPGEFRRLASKSSTNYLTIWRITIFPECYVNLQLDECGKVLQSRGCIIIQVLYVAAAEKRARRVIMRSGALMSNAGNTE